jgi:hypothetical protein
VAWLHRIFGDKAGDGGLGNKGSLTDHDVLDASAINEPAQLEYGEAHDFGGWGQAGQFG